MTGSRLWLALGVLVLAGCGSAGGAPALRVDRPTALWDKPVSITVTGARSNAVVELRASAVDYRGVRYASATMARADGHGRLTLRGNSAMRLVWSLAPKGGPPYYYVSREWTAPITLSARVRGHSLTTILRREGRAPGIRTRMLRVAHDGVYGELFTPRPQGRKPGILVIGGSEGGLHPGVDEWMLSSHGYTTLSVAYFDAPALPQDLHNILLEYFARALRILAAEPGVDPSRIVVYGISYGGQVAQLLGIHYPTVVHGVVALVTANGSWCGIPALQSQPRKCLGAAWTFHGKPIPYDPYSNPYSSPAPFHDEAINGPIFLACGEADRFASCPSEQAIVARLHAHHFSHGLAFLDYPNVGHGIGELVPYTPAYDPSIDGDHPDANQRARVQAWPKLLRFLAAL